MLIWFEGATSVENMQFFHI